MICE
jgi:hypothetical protein